MNSPFPYDYICIEGNIGAGKTSFCNILAEKYNCKLILEEFDDNPFLPFFYDDPEKFAFSVELFFMTERYKQLERSILHPDLFADFTISDYAFVKTQLFARKNLVEKEFHLFNKLFTVLNASFPQPEILVYFHRNVDILLENIRKRGRSYETKIKAEYLQSVQDSYFDYFRSILSYPVVIIDLNDIDFLANPSHFDTIESLISKKYNPGVHRISLLV